MLQTEHPQMSSLQSASWLQCLSVSTHHSSHLQLLGRGCLLAVLTSTILILIGRESCGQLAMSPKTQGNELGVT